MISADQAMGFARSWVAAQQLDGRNAVLDHLADPCELICEEDCGQVSIVRGRRAVAHYWIEHVAAQRGADVRLGHVLIDFEKSRVAIVYLTLDESPLADLLELGPDRRVVRGEVLTGQKARDLSAVHWL